MKKIITVLLFSFFIIHTAKAQQAKTYFYKGTVDGKMPITLYLKAEENACTPDLNYTGMYQYDKVSNWLQVNITQNEKKQFVMVEYGFTGVLILSQTPTSFEGLWISPDAKRQLKVKFKKVPLTSKEIKTYENKMEQLNYENNDC